MSFAIDGNRRRLVDVVLRIGTLGGKRRVASSPIWEWAIGTFAVSSPALLPYRSHAGDGAIPAKIAEWGSRLKRAGGADPETIGVDTSRLERPVPSNSWPRASAPRTPTAATSRNGLCRQLAQRGVVSPPSQPARRPRAGDCSPGGRPWGARPAAPSPLRPRSRRVPKDHRP